jgi:hypothetical protein
MVSLKTQCLEADHSQRKQATCSASRITWILGKKVRRLQDQASAMHKNYASGSCSTETEQRAGKVTNWLWVMDVI